MGAYRLVTLLGPGQPLPCAWVNWGYGPLRGGASPRQGGLSMSQGIQLSMGCLLSPCTRIQNSEVIRHCSPEKHACSKQWLCLLLSCNNIYVKLTCNTTYALVKIIFYMEVNLEDSGDTVDPTHVSFKRKLIMAQNHFHSFCMRCVTPTVIHDLVFKQSFEINNDNLVVKKKTLKKQN